jgi:hypothetical protein
MRWRSFIEIDDSGGQFEFECMERFICYGGIDGDTLDFFGISFPEFALHGFFVREFASDWNGLDRPN